MSLLSHGRASILRVQSLAIVFGKTVGARQAAVVLFRSC